VQQKKAFDPRERTGSPHRTPLSKPRSSLIAVLSATTQASCQKISRDIFYMRINRLMSSNILNSMCIISGARTVAVQQEGPSHHRETRNEKGRV
jgi:uncharacterized membrane protein YeiH